MVTVRHSILALVVFLGSCGQLGGSAGNGNSSVQIAGQTISQDIINCMDAPAEGGSQHFGLNLPNTRQAPDPDAQFGYQGLPGLAFASDSFAFYAPIEGAPEFYGFPIEAALNEAWVVRANVEEIASAVARERDLAVTLDQLRTSSEPGFRSAVYLEAEVSYQPEWATQASDGRYDFALANARYTFPEVQIEESDTTAKLTLWELAPGLTLAQCFVENPMMYDGID